MRKLAQLISIVLGVPWLFVIIWLLIFETGLNNKQIQFFSFTLPILLLAVPFAYMLWAMKEGIISDFDITKRKERFSVMLLMLVVNVMSLVLIFFYGTMRMFEFSLLVTGVFVAVSLITLFWKISLHMTINVVAILLLNGVFGWGFWYLLGGIPLVFWSRLYLKKHTPMQLLGGLLVSSGIMLGGMWMIGR